ncbi:MAG: serine/threonine-protein kinase [Bacteroidota bacterium]
MSENRWSKIERLLEEASARAPQDRAAFLDSACPDDDLRAEVERLLDADATAYFRGLGQRVGESVDAALADAMLGRRVGRWRLVAHIGRGGMGTVYRAERADGTFEQVAALKLLDTMRSDVVARFEQERQILARLDHPGIARLLDGGTTPEGRPYLVMEYVPGEPITDYAARRSLGVADRLELFREVCAAVQAAHQSLVVHRDLKPSNVFVTENAEGTPSVKLLDFGIARLLEDDPDAALTRTGDRLLTPEYAAPEQVRGEAITTATDVYALGVLLYELLAGTRPFNLPGRLLHEVARVIVEEEPERPSTAVTRADAAVLAAPRQTMQRRLSGDLDQICLKALRKAPGERYATAEAFARDVTRHVEGRPVEAQAPTVGYRLARYVRRNRVALGVAAAFVALVLIYALTATLQAQRVADERDIAREEQAKAEEITSLLIGLFEQQPGETVVQRRDSLTAYDLLDRGVAHAGDLTDQPAVQARLLGTIANIFLVMGDYPRAEQVYGMAVDSLRTNAGASHPDYPEWLKGYGAALRIQGMRQEAMPYFREGIERVEAQPAPDLGLLADLLNLLSLTLEQLGRYDEAEPLARRVVVLEEQGIRDETPEAYRARAYGNLVVVLVRQERYAEAITWAEQALTIRRAYAAADPANVDFAWSLANIAALHMLQGNPEAAVAPAQEAAAAVSANLGADHPIALAFQSDFANVRVQLGGDDSLATDLRAILAAQGGRPDADPAALAQTRYVLGRALQLGADHREAVSHLQEAHATRQTLLGPDHPVTAKTGSTLGVSLTATGQLAEAARLLVHADSVFTAAADTTRDRCTALDRLAALRTAQGDDAAHAEAQARYDRLGCTDGEAR